MRKTLVAAAVILAIASLAVFSGCRNSGDNQQVDLNDILLEGKNWTYEGSKGDLIVFAEDGTFRSVIDEKVEDGTYKVFQTDDGEWVELTFLDEKGNQDRVEEWSMTADIGEGDTITDLQGQEYLLRGTKETLR